MTKTKLQWMEWARGYEWRTNLRGARLGLRVFRPWRNDPTWSYQVRYMGTQAKEDNGFTSAEEAKLAAEQAALDLLRSYSKQIAEDLEKLL